MAETSLQSAQRKKAAFNSQKADLQRLYNESKRAANAFRPENTTNAATSAREQADTYSDALRGMSMEGLLTSNEQTAINKFNANAKKSPSMFSQFTGLFRSSAPAASGSAGRPPAAAAAAAPASSGAYAAPASSAAYTPPAYTPPAAAAAPGRSRVVFEPVPRGATPGVYVNSKGRTIVNGGRRRRRLTKRRHTKRRKSRRSCK